MWQANGQPRRAALTADILGQLGFGALHRVSVGLGIVMGGSVDESVLRIRIGDELELPADSGSGECARGPDQAATIAVRPVILLAGEYQHRQPQARDKIGHGVDRSRRRIPGDDDGSDVGHLRAVNQHLAPALRKSDQTDLSGDRVWHLLGLLDGGSQGRALVSCDVVGVEQDGVIAELRDLRGETPLGSCAFVAGDHDDHASLALRRGKFLLRLHGRDGGHKNDEAEDYGRDVNKLNLL